MKKDIAQIASYCLKCQQVKVEHHHPPRVLHPHDITKTKCESISMDFIVRLATTPHRNDCIMVVVDKLTKITHFNPTKKTFDVVVDNQVFLQEIIALH